MLLDFRETVRQIAEDASDPELRESAKRAEERLDRELLALPAFTQPRLVNVRLLRWFRNAGRNG